MLFNSVNFIFLFLPVNLLIYYLLPVRFRNVFLLFASLIFYSWSGVSLSLILLFSLLANYVFGRLISSVNQKKGALIFGIVLNLSLLVVFKYANFIVSNISFLRENIGLQPLPDLGIMLPIGISFFTFQSISYLVDVYRKDTQVQKNIINLSLYISLFPQLIAGPIVRYHDIHLQLANRIHNLRNFRQGIERFIIGLAKKVLLANNFALVADQIFSINPDSLSTSAAWFGAILYAFQIYFDFSGYSDMAIGLGKMFGFRFLENFNFPYVAKSIKEFWRRWHISLSNWFRDYLYIPLGGNRKGNFRVYLNLLIVFFLTGFWHGASWSFVFWGLFHGLFLIVERLGLGKILSKTGRIVPHFYTLLVVLVGWVFFRIEEIDIAFLFVAKMFSFQNGAYSALNFLTPLLLFLVPIGIIGSSNLLPITAKRLVLFLRKSGNIKAIYLILKAVFLISLLGLSILFILSDQYNPFIYFRF